jgi:hypothetical protein
MIAADRTLIATAVATLIADAVGRSGGGAALAP